MGWMCPVACPCPCIDGSGRSIPLHSFSMERGRGRRNHRHSIHVEVREMPELDAQRTPNCAVRTAGARGGSSQRVIGWCESHTRRTSGHWRLKRTFSNAQGQMSETRIQDRRYKQRRVPHNPRTHRYVLRYRCHQCRCLQVPANCQCQWGWRTTDNDNERLLRL